MLDYKPNMSAFQSELERSPLQRECQTSDVRLSLTGSSVSDRTPSKKSAA